MHFYYLSNMCIHSIIICLNILPMSLFSFLLILLLLLILLYVRTYVKNDALRNYIVQRHTSNVKSLLQIKVSPLGFPYQYFDLHPISTADEFVCAVSS